MAIFVGPTSGIKTAMFAGGGTTGAFVGLSTTTTGRNAGVGTITGALIYNDDQSDKAVAVIAFGGDKTVSSGTFTIQFPAAAASTAIIRIA